MICLRRRNLLRSLDHLAKPGLAPSATDQTVPGGWDRLEPVLLRDTPWKNREIYAKTKDLRSSGGVGEKPPTSPCLFCLPLRLTWLTSFIALELCVWWGWGMLNTATGKMVENILRWVENDMFYTRNNDTWSIYNIENIWKTLKFQVLTNKQDMFWMWAI